MFGRKPTDESKKLNQVIDRAYDQMLAMNPDDPNYSKMIVTLARLHELKTTDRRKEVSPDTIAIVLGNLLGILIIVAYEQKHVMVSKAFGFGLKPKT